MLLSRIYQLNRSLPGPHPTLPENPSQGDQTLLLALQALDAADYAHAVTLINESLEQGISFDQGRAEALNLRGTFKCVQLNVFIYCLEY